MFAPKRNDKTLAFEAANKDRKEELSRLHILVELNQYDLNSYREKAQSYNDDLVKSGGQAGFGFAMFKDR